MSLGASQDISVKCRAMYSRLLDASEYGELLSMKSVKQIAVYLKNETQYAYVLRQIDENDVHRGQLEQILKKSLFYDYERLLRFSRGNDKAAVRAMFETFEIEDLKLVISSICSEHENMLAPGDLTYTIGYSGYPVDLLLEADTMEDLVENLRETRYYEPLLPFAVRENPDFLKIDRALNLINYRAKSGAYRDALSGASRKTAVMLFGIQADIENILYIYRFKKLYNYNAGEILTCLNPNEYLLYKKELIALANCAGVNELTDRIGDTKYGFLFPKCRESEWESLHAEFFYQLHKRNVRRSGGDAGVALSYLYMKEIDIKNIIMVIEGIRYSLPAAKIASFLIGYKPANSFKEQMRRLRGYKPADGFKGQLRKLRGRAA